MKRKLGEILVERGFAGPGDIDAALADQSAGEPARLGDQLVAAGRITPMQLAQALSEQYGLPFTGLPTIPPAVLNLFELDVQRMHRLVPFREDRGRLLVALADPANAEAKLELEALVGRTIALFVAPADEIDAIHAALAGEVVLNLADLPPALELPSVAPSIGRAGAGVARRHTPAPTPDDLFGSLELDGPMTDPEVPVVSAPSPGFSLKSGTGGAALDFMDLASELDTGGASAAAPAFDFSGALQESHNEAPPPASMESMLFKDVTTEPEPEGAGRSLESMLFKDPTTAPEATMEEDPFNAFNDAAQSPSASPPVPLPAKKSRPKTAPASSPKPAAKKEKAPPPPSASPAETVEDGEALPGWLKSGDSMRAGGDWTGALEGVDSEQLGRALARALVRRGILTEQDLLDSLDPE